MKNIEVSDAVYAALERLATGRHDTPAEVLASLLSVPTASHEATEPIAAFIISGEFRAAFTDAEKYLSLLSWVATRHSSEFSEFIRSQSVDGLYLTMSREEILEACQHNQARQIDGTQYWAIMSIDPVTKRRFVARLLEFIGYRDAVIEVVCSALGGTVIGKRGRSAILVS